MFARIKVTDIPPQIPRFDISEISYVRDLVATISVVSCKGILFALKAHELARQNDGFPVEVKSLIQLGTVPHVAQLMGVVTELSPFDSESSRSRDSASLLSKGGLEDVVGEQ